MNKKLFWLYITSMWLSVRIVLFEKYAFVLMLVWWVPSFILAFAVRPLYSGSEFIVLGVAFLLRKRFYLSMANTRARWIRRGDWVEFVEDGHEGYIQVFKHGKVLRKMRGEDVALTGLFEKELIPVYSHFYLLEMEEKNIIVPYEWIVSIELKDVPEV